MPKIKTISDITRCERSKEIWQKKINVIGTEITVAVFDDNDYICITDMLKAKDGDFLYRIGCETGAQLNF